MKVKDLMALLANAHPDTPVCFFTEQGADEVTRVDVYEGYYMKDMSPKMSAGWTDGVYVGIGNPGDFEETQSCTSCNPIFDLERNEPIV